MRLKTPRIYNATTQKLVGQELPRLEMFAEVCARACHFDNNKQQTSHLYQLIRGRIWSIPFNLQQPSVQIPHECPARHEYLREQPVVI